MPMRWSSAAGRSTGAETAIGASHGSRTRDRKAAAVMPQARSARRWHWPCHRPGPAARSRPASGRPRPRRPQERRGQRAPGEGRDAGPGSSPISRTSSAAGVRTGRSRPSSSPSVRSVTVTGLRRSGESSLSAWRAKTLVSTTVIDLSTGAACGIAADQSGTRGSAHASHQSPPSSMGALLRKVSAYGQDTRTLSWPAAAVRRAGHDGSRSRLSSLPATTPSAPSP